MNTVRFLGLSFLAASLAFAYPAAAEELQCEREITASDGEILDEFGKAIAVDGDVMVVGATRRDEFGDDAGAAYVYRFDGADWFEEAKLVGDDVNGNDLFGKDVDVDGDTIVVGAEGHDAQRGAAYVFRHDGTAWAQEAKLRPLDPFAHEHFGVSISLQGDAVVVGADREMTGAAFVFRRGPSGWYEEQKLTPSDPTADQRFGFSVDLDGDTIVVGAFRLPRGAAYVFRHDGSSWVEEQRLDAADGADLDQFGWSVAVDGDVVVVGAATDDDLGSDSGSAYVFRHDGSGWFQERKLLASDGGAAHLFGNAVAIDGDGVVVGAWLADPRGRESGAAYYFEHGASGWQESVRLAAPVGRSFDRFGESLDLRGKNLVVGMPGTRSRFPPRGTAWAWRFAPEDNRAPVADAGGDQAVDCSRPGEGEVFLDGSASFDPDSTPEEDDIVAYNWYESFDQPDEQLLGRGATLDLTLPSGRYEITLLVADVACTSGTDSITVRVDATPPVGRITAPEPGLCVGEAGLPVRVEDDFTDDCDDELDRIYSPVGGPDYYDHGDKNVVLRVLDAAENEASDSVFFIIDRIPPRVFLTAPDTMAVGAEMPFSDFFFVYDNDSATGGSVLEQVFWDDCLMFDGGTYGNGNGILSDDTLLFGLPVLCEAMARCGIGEIDDSVVRVEATDCGGNLDFAQKTIQTDPVVFLQDCEVAVGAASDAVITWEPLFEAQSYDAIRGDLDAVRDAGEQVDLGQVVCLAEDVTQTSVVDSEVPEPGRAFFYLVRFRHGPTLSEYGRSSSDKPERPAGGDCAP